ncbi:MAG TPA: methyltransferase domain-containing protein [Kofleriaceae bacterium]|nr:methyltransferase domain-containing protein [Kofleriaceae bacterium]
MFRPPGALVDDASFDERLPLRLQVQAPTHFTPVEIARRAAQLLAPAPGMTVLDVGAGAGKLCLVAALAAPDCEFVGIEWRPHLVDVASALARELGIRNARFLHGDALELDWSAFDSIYLYNPFAEQLEDEGFALDRTIERDPALFVTSVFDVRRKLARARAGTRVVTFHGYGAPFPPGYEQADEDTISGERLELWIKTEAG